MKIGRYSRRDLTVRTLNCRITKFLEESKEIQVRMLNAGNLCNIDGESFCRVSQMHKECFEQLASSAGLKEGKAWKCIQLASSKHASLLLLLFLLQIPWRN